MKHVSHFHVTRNYHLELEPEDEHGPAMVSVYLLPDKERREYVWSVQHGLKKRSDEQRSLLSESETAKLSDLCLALYVRNCSAPPTVGTSGSSDLLYSTPERHYPPPSEK